MKKNIFIGLSVVLAICILFFGIEFLKGINVFKSVNYYEASYTDVQGLEVSAPVSLNGFKVGLVKDVQYEYDNPGHVLVELSLNKDLRLPLGTKAVIETDLLGTATIVLHMGESNEYYKVGARIEGITSGGMMNALSDDLLPSVSNVIPTVDTLLNNINTLVEDPALTAAIARLDAITASVQSTLETIDHAVKPLPEMVQSVKSVAVNLDTISNNVALLSKQLAASDIDATLENINTITADLKTTAEALNSNTSTVGKLLNDPVLYDNLSNATASLDSLLNDIKANPKRYISIKLL